MITGYFTEGFLKSTTNKKSLAGKRVFENDLVTKCDYSIIEGTHLAIEGEVISESLFNTYTVYINFELESFKVIELSCTCQDFEKNEMKKKNYACKHINAVFLKFLEKAKDDSLLKGLIESKNSIEAILNRGEKLNNFTLDTLINADLRKEASIEVYLNRNSWSKKISVEFKIGGNTGLRRKMYVIKDIQNFLVNYYNSVPQEFGRDFIFSTKEYRFTNESKNIISFIETIYEMDIQGRGFKKSQDKLINRKEMTIPQGLLKTFLKSILGCRIYLNNGFYSREVETEILMKDIPLPIELREEEDGFYLELLRELPEPLTSDYNVFLYETSIYIPSNYQNEKLVPYFKAFNGVERIKFNLQEKEKIFMELIPSMKLMTNTLILNEKILEQIVVKEPRFKFYFNRDDFIRATIKVCYGEYEFNVLNEFTRKFIYRDRDKENNAINLLKSMYFQPIEDKTFVFIGDEERAFRFFKEEIDKLRPIGEIFYSDGFKGKLDLDKESFKIEVSRGREDYFELKYKINGIDENEYYDILRSFKDGKKYYKLNTGDYIDLEEVNLKELLSLVESLKPKGEETIEFNKNKGIYVNEKLKRIACECSGEEALENIEKTLLNVKIEEAPKEINAVLRDYQKHGINWFKQLKSLGFGGILGDEMGLGKTLQAISFITSEKNSKTLIVAPTSLVFNWRDEFSKFSPKIKVALATGSKATRRVVLDKIENFDVIVTTYNLLRNDLDLYEKIDFDLMFIDEAQYIKNPLSKNAKACKKIKSKARFALTGTPIENNLMELWSIFDFIMPNYLFDKNTFNSMYNRNLSEDRVLIEDLKGLISPFILRRLKRDVLRELPEKIEKVLPVEMTGDQKKVYSYYTKYIRDLIEKKVSDGEFKRDRIEILSYITKLRQVALDPSLVIDNYEGESGKINALKEILEDAIDSGHKILVFSQFTKALTKIREVLTANNITTYYLDGSVKAEERNNLVNKFNSDDTNVFLISLKAGGTGLNLTSADIVIHFDPWWNPASESQATDRAHRIGQENVVQVIKLISEGTVEEKILKLQNMKRDLVENLIGGESLSNSLLSNLTKENLLELLSK